MKLQTERRQPDLGEAPVYYLKSRHLLGDEQDGLALRQRVGNDVGDGLGLAGAGRAFQHEVASRVDRADRFELRRIREHRRANVLRAVGIVQPSPLGRLLPIHCEGLAGMLDKVFDDAVALQLLGPVLQVLPHQVLREAEDPQMGFFTDLPFRQLPSG